MKNTPLISPRLAPYDIIHVQEDFNSHAALYASDNHQHRTPTSGGAGIGSGLNTLSNFDYIDFTRSTWNDCNLNSGDCLTPKGFTYMRVKVSSGVWVDFYNLHTDAGSDSGDITARSKNFAQVTTFMKTWSAGMPVIVMGDTNSRYTRLGDSDSLRTFVSTNGLTDAWVKNIRNGTPPAAGSTDLVCPFPFPSGTSQATMVACEVVDKIFVRSGPALTSFQPTTFTNENNAFLNSTNYPLSDHYPDSSLISWSLSSSLRSGDPVGGPHGDPYNDLATALSSPSGVLKLTAITIRSGSRIDAVSYSLAFPDGTLTTIVHGGTGGSADTLVLGSGERIVQVKACSAQYQGDTRVFYISFTTSAGKSLSGGVETGDCSTQSVPTEAGAEGKAWGLVGSWGRSGDEVDRLAPIWGAAY